MKEKVTFFAPVEEKYLSRWEYYQVDFEALSEEAQAKAGRFSCQEFAFNGFNFICDALNKR